jgi:ABC-type branched-subunit amino acid transport system substrate-binding protein
MAVGLVAAACGRSDDTATDSSGSDGTTAPGAEPVAGPGFDGTTINLGVITPQTGTAALLGNPLTAGNQVYWDSVNAEGGVAGKYPVQLDVVDSKYEAATAVQQYADTKSDVVMYQQVLGTAIVDTLLPQLGTDGIFAGPASLDAFWVREPNLMPIGAPYQIQAINALDYAQRELDADNKVICAVTKDDPYGETGLAGLEYGAEQLGLTIDRTTTFKQGDTVFTGVLDELETGGDPCEIVWLTALPTETIPLLTEAAGRSYAPTWIGQSPTWVSLLAAGDLGPYVEANFLLMSEGPQWGDTSVEGMAQMLDAIEQFAPDTEPDIYFAFGYAQAWAAHQILEQAVERGDLSPAGILTASEEIDQLTFGDLLGDYTYGPVEDRNPPRASTIFAVSSTAPGALEALEVNYTSTPAEDYVFDD